LHGVVASIGRGWFRVDADGSADTLDCAGDDCLERGGAASTNGGGGNGAGASSTRTFRPRTLSGCGRCLCRGCRRLSPRRNQQRRSSAKFGKREGVLEGEPGLWGLSLVTVSKAHGHHIGPLRGGVRPDAHHSSGPASLRWSTRWSPAAAFGRRSVEAKGRWQQAMLRTCLHRGFDPGAVVFFTFLLR